MASHSYDLARARGLTFLVIMFLVNEWYKIRDLTCSTNIINKKVVKDQSRQSIKGKDPRRNKRRDKAQMALLP